MTLQNTLTSEQMSMLADLFRRGSMDSLQSCVKGIDELDYFQTIAVAYAVITRHCLLNIDTGLGKTLIAAGVINILAEMKPGLKWIYLCQCGNLSTTANKLKQGLFNGNLVYCDSTESQLLDTFFTLKCQNANVMVLSYEAITQPVVEGFLFKHREEYKGFILDESQMLANLTSHTSRLVSAIMNNATYRVMLSATPLRVAIEQVVNQVYMIDREMFADVNMQTFLNQFRVWDDKAVVGYKNLEYLQQMLMPRMLSISRSDLQMRGSYVPIVHMCQTDLDDEADSCTVATYKSLQSSSTMIKLLEVVSSYKRAGKRGVIYANRNVLKRALSTCLAGLGLRVAILDGSVTTTQQKKTKVHQMFLNGELDVLITNITTGKDLPCDYIAFYELTFDYKQMIGRGERGLTGKDLEVLFFITDSIYETRFFYTKVYQRGVLLEKLCGKDMPELHEAIVQIERKLQSKGITFDEILQD